jgi:hypothetical protein
MTRRRRTLRNPLSCISANVRFRESSHFGRVEAAIHDRRKRVDGGSTTDCPGRRTACGQQGSVGMPMWLPLTRRSRCELDSPLAHMNSP